MIVRYLGVEGSGPCIRPLRGLVRKVLCVVHITVLCCYSTSSPRAIDSGSYDWKKLDPKAEETKALVAQYWKWEVIFTSNLSNDIK